MPWKASSVMDERLRFVACLLVGEPMTDGCREFGISRKTGYKIFDGLVTPFRACGPAGGSVATGMKKISYRGYRFPPEIIQQAIWLYLRFTLSLLTSKTCWRNGASWSPTRLFGAG